MVKCVICKDPIKGYKNNPDPIKKKGSCCDNCNIMMVIPARTGKLWECQECKEWVDEHEAMVLAEAELGLGPVESYIVCNCCYENDIDSLDSDVNIGGIA